MTDEQIAIAYMIAHKDELLVGQSYIVVQDGVAQHYPSFAVAYEDVVNHSGLWEFTYQGWPEQPVRISQAQHHNRRVRIKTSQLNP